MKKTVITFIFSLILLHDMDIKAADNLSFHIEMLNWEEVNTLLPRYAKFTVMDVETGKQFRVQRRAGSSHADVQPLTAIDTRVMKQIYGGKWSWKRRAIIVIHKDQWIAASMHGMPHGAGTLKNNFPGHFCIHFYGSTTHRTHSMDLSHLLMILKSAGKLDDYLAVGNPYEVVNAYFVGLKQQDKLISSRTSIQKIAWGPVLNKIDNVKISRMELLPPEDLNEQISLSIPIEVDWFLKNRGRESYKGELLLVRFSPHEPWRIDSKKFLKENKLLK